MFLTGLIIGILIGAVGVFVLLTCLPEPKEPQNWIAAEDTRSRHECDKAVQLPDIGVVQNADGTWRAAADGEAVQAWTRNYGYVFKQPTFLNWD